MELETAPGPCCRETILIARFVAVCIGVLPAGGACRAGHDHRDDSQVVGYGVSAAGGHYDSSWNLPSHIRPIFGGYYGDPVSGRGAGEQLRSSLFQGCHLGPQAVQFAIYLRKRRLRLSFLQVVAPTCCLDECLNLRSEKAQPGIAVDGTLSVLQLAVADRLDDLVLSESELGASSLVAQGGALASPLGFEAVDDSPLPRNGLVNGATGDDMV